MSLGFSDRNVSQALAPHAEWAGPGSLKPQGIIFSEMTKCLDSFLRAISVVTLPVWPTFTASYSHCRTTRPCLRIISLHLQPVKVTQRRSQLSVVKKSLIWIKMYPTCIAHPLIQCKDGDQPVISHLDQIQRLYCLKKKKLIVGVETSWSVRGKPCLLFQYAGTI